MGPFADLGIALTGIAGARAPTVLGLDADLMAAGQHCIFGYHVAAIVDLPHAARAHHLDGLADQPTRYRVPVAVNGHQPILGHHTLSDQSVQETGLAGPRHEGRRFLGEAVDEPLVSRAMHPNSDHGLGPAVQWHVEIVQIPEHPAGQKIALYVFHPRLHLTFGLRPVQPAQPRLEAPVSGKGLERRMPAGLAFGCSQDDRAHAVRLRRRFWQNLLGLPSHQKEPNMGDE